MTRMHAALAPYLIHISSEAQRTGVGMMRPFCLTNPGEKWRGKKDAYYLGDDLLVYPVMKPRARRIRIEIPEGQWVGLFDGKPYHPGTHDMDCPLGQPAVLYRRDTPFADIFKKIGEVGVKAQF